MFIALIEMLFWKLRWLVDVFSDYQIFHVLCMDGCNNSATANSNSATFQMMFDDILPRWDGQVWIHQNNDPFPFVIIYFEIGKTSESVWNCRFAFVSFCILTLNHFNF